jgi:hypothetical protein
MKIGWAKFLSTALIAAALSLSLAPVCPGGEVCGMPCCRQSAAHRSPQPGADCCAAAPQTSAPSASLCTSERPDAASAPGVFTGSDAFGAAALETKFAGVAGASGGPFTSAGSLVLKVPIYLSGHSLLI